MPRAVSCRPVLIALSEPCSTSCDAKISTGIRVAITLISSTPGVDALKTRLLPSAGIRTSVPARMRDIGLVPVGEEYIAA